MARLGGTATDSHLAAFRGLETHFKRLGIDLDWVLYSDDEAVVDAFVAGEIDMAKSNASLKDMAWNPPARSVITFD